MEDFGISLISLRNKYISEIFRSHNDIEKACQTGRYFACKCPRKEIIFLFMYIILLFLGVIEFIPNSGVSGFFVGIVSSLCILLIFWSLIKIKTYFLLIGPIGIIFIHFKNRTFLKWDQILSVELIKGYSGYQAIKIKTIKGIIDVLINEFDYSPLDSFPQNGNAGLFELIQTYFQLIKKY